MIVAGDFNIWRGEGRWVKRYQTVFDRLVAEGFSLEGPFAPDGVSNIPTFRSAGAAARHQTDFVFG
jgi:endonuclease/exonuclease/phosphatase family metal-dependent hydrolase